MKRVLQMAATTVLLAPLASIVLLVIGFEWPFGLVWMRCADCLDPILPESAINSTPVGPMFSFTGIGLVYVIPGVALFLLARRVRGVKGREVGK
jgi:hypothetical protein